MCLSLFCKAEILSSSHCVSVFVRGRVSFPHSVTVSIFVRLRFCIPPCVCQCFCKVESLSDDKEKVCTVLLGFSSFFSPPDCVFYLPSFFFFLFKKLRWRFCRMMRKKKRCWHWQMKTSRQHWRRWLLWSRCWWRSLEALTSSCTCPRRTTWPSWVGAR